MVTSEISYKMQPCGVLRCSEIKRLIEEHGLIENSDPNSIQPASYDARVGKFYWVPGSKDTHCLDEGEIIPIDPRGVVIIQSLERFHLPSNVVGHTGPRRDLTLNLIELMDSGGQIDPGYEGHLLSLLRNGSTEKKNLRYGETYATIEFRYTTPAKPEDPLYHGVFQNKTLKQVLAEVIQYKIADEASAVASHTNELSQDLQELDKQLDTIRSELRVDWSEAARELEMRMHREIIKFALPLILFALAIATLAFMVLVLRS